MENIKSICVFCGSRPGNDPAHAQAAQQLGRTIAERGIRLVYGGGGVGLMKIVAQSAIDAGGEVTGIIPKFLMKLEVGDVPGTEVVVVESMHERKQKMFEMSDAVVALPGGIGTLDEVIEITTWKQLQQHAKPIVMINHGGYWDPYVALIERVIEGGYGHGKLVELFTMVETVDEVFTAIANAPEPDRIVLTSHL